MRFDFEKFLDRYLATRPHHHTVDVLREFRSLIEAAHILDVRAERYAKNPKDPVLQAGLLLAIQNVQKALCDLGVLDD